MHDASRGMGALGLLSAALLAISGCSSTTGEDDQPAVSHAEQALTSNANDEPIYPPGLPAVSRWGTHVLQGDPSINGPFDVRATWDEQKLYLTITVKEGDVSPRDSRWLWEDDSVEIYIDADHSRGSTYDGRNDFQFVLRPFANEIEFGVNSVRNATGITYRTETPKYRNYYFVLVELPWSTLGVRPSAGHLLGLDVHVNDDDDGGARDRKEALFATIDDAWTNPRSFGSVRLRSAEQGRHDFFQTLNPWTTVDGFYVSLLPSLERHTRNVLLGTPPAASDSAASWWTMWSEGGLYVYAAVTDDAHVTDSPYPWEDDSVELFVDVDHSRGTRYDGVNDSQYVFRYDDPVVHVGTRSRPNVEGISFAFGWINSSTYSFEAYIPWSTLGGTPDSKGQIGIDLHVNDDDDGGSRDNKLATYATVDDAWTNPSRFGSAEVVAGTSL